MGAVALDTALRGLDTAESKRILVLHTSVSPSGEIQLTVVGQSKEAFAYDVRIGHTLHCTCEAFVRRPLNSTGSAYTFAADPERINHCKHLFWVKKEILRIPISHPMFRRLNYRSWELAYLLQHSKLSAHRASPVMLNAFNRLDGTIVEAKPVPDADTLCPFDFEPVSPEESYCFCEAGCRTAFFHTACAADYRAYCEREKETPRCPQCRAQLVEISEPQVKTVKNRLSFGAMRPPSPKKPRAGSRSSRA